MIEVTVSVNPVRAAAQRWEAVGFPPPDGLIRSVWFPSQGDGAFYSPLSPCSGGVAPHASAGPVPCFCGLAWSGGFWPT